ncbi:hypothetical protein HMPREF0290_2193 [Corynebacterium efficiens YS-314]|uniref:Uncharacterized protein n=1 Tax=Corynebacterium efficiens (strain DSM 44549 / YS-314 / AJ 12310 / JCM 11189 / NBRC 100395) TaxID=196164 RepID=Q8FNI8_COREF|nr:hypothetical protein [Corynebacterium efficiens]EEW49120.1 hypothetical protein HMPREF0290_2193 [Corynebacterium efficiens YS-314]BAC18966.1 hypothetical protein [Corynebacterium efficiens YS-314]
MTLPRDDQPDTYTGIWNRVQITHVVPDSSRGVMHLVMPKDTVRTFCTTTNPVWVCTTRRPETIGAYIQGRADKWRLHGGPILTPCPECLTLAAVEAEMRGQNKYPIQRLLDGLARTTTPQAKS